MKWFSLVLILLGMFHSVPVSGAVFVFEAAIGLPTQPNPNALLLSDPRTAQGLQIGQITIGTGYFRVEEDQVDFQLWIQPYSGPLTTLQIESGGVTAEIGLGAGDYLYSANLYHFSNPYLPQPAWMQSEMNLDGSISLGSYYMFSIPSVSEYNIFSGSITNAALAAMISSSQSAEMVAFGSTGIQTTSPRGSLAFVGTPEPSRALLLLVGIISILHRRRRTLGSG